MFLAILLLFLLRSPFLTLSVSLSIYISLTLSLLILSLYFSHYSLTISPTLFLSQTLSLSLSLSHLTPKFKPMVTRPIVSLCNIESVHSDLIDCIGFTFKHWNNMVPLIPTTPKCHYATIANCRSSKHMHNLSLKLLHLIFFNEFERECYSWRFSFSGDFSRYHEWRHFYRNTLPDYLLRV